MVEPLTVLLNSRALSLAAAAGVYADLIRKIVFHRHPLDADTVRALLADVNIHLDMALAWINHQAPPPPTSTCTCTGTGTGWCPCSPDTDPEDGDTTP